MSENVEINEAAKEMLNSCCPCFLLNNSTNQIMLSTVSGVAELKSFANIKSADQPVIRKTPCEMKYESYT